VLLFGSLLAPRRFHERSDVDLAVMGLDEQVYLRALARLLDLDPSIPVDLIELEHAGPGLRSTVEREGKAL
jgi:predicted nucleotidyltransferase